MAMSDGNHCHIHLFLVHHFATMCFHIQVNLPPTKDHTVALEIPYQLLGWTSRIKIIYILFTIKRTNVSIMMNLVSNIC